MLGNPGYRKRWQRKLIEYLEAGIKPHEDGGGPAGTPIVTRDGGNGGIDSAAITQLIKYVLG